MCYRICADPLNDKTLSQIALFAVFIITGVKICEFSSYFQQDAGESCFCAGIIIQTQGNDHDIYTENHSACALAVSAMLFPALANARER